MQDVKGTQVVRQLNRNRVLGLLRAGPTNRAALAKALDLSKNTISLLIDELISEGLVTETGPQESGVGRPAIGIELNPAARLVLGVQYDRGTLNFAVTGLDVMPMQVFSLPLANSHPETVVETLRVGVAQVTASYDIGGFQGVGLGMPGLVDSQNRMVLTSRLGWRDVPIAQMMEAALSLPCYVVNLQHAAVLAELWHGAGQGLRNFVYCSLGSGVGGGLVVNRELYQGHTATAGELGHVTILPDGPLCTCGNRGCLESLVGETALAARARELLRGSNPSNSPLWNAVGGFLEHIEAGQIAAAASRGDQVALQVVEETADYLAIGLGGMVNLFSPEAIIITCRLPGWQEVLARPLEAALQRRALHVPLSGCRVVWSELGTRATAIGAAALALTRTGWNF